MKILIIGGGGMLGHKLVSAWHNKFDVWTTLRGEISDYKKFNIFEPRKSFEKVDVLSFEKVKKIISEIQPQVVINAVGVIKQLPISKNIINTLEINSVFPHKLNKLAEEESFRLITIGTDCVFSGKKGNYAEGDTADAEDLYGKSKNLGEIESANSLTLRTSIIGHELFTRHSLLEWFLSQEGKKVNGYKKAVFSGFPTAEMAKIIADIITNYKNLTGLYHISSSPINKFDLLQLIKKSYQLNIEIEAFEDFHIDRSLDSTKFRIATGFQPQSWEEMVEAMAQDKKNYLQR